MEFNEQDPDFAAVRTENTPQRRIFAQGLDISFDPTDANELSELNLAEQISIGEGATQSKFYSQPLDLEWQNIKLTVPVKRGGLGKPTTRPDGTPLPREKVILTKMSGSVKSGQLLAIMGSSGAGKTSLMNLLAGRATATKGAKVEGSVLVNGSPRDFSSFRHQSAYVLQDDDMFAELTVREQVGYAAQLRLPGTMSSRAKSNRVERVIQELGLVKVIDSTIGGAQVRGVSGGERKRVAIATELVTDPSILFLDEPTSGLDSASAQNVMQTLRSLASRGRTVVCTIHQPRSSIFALFDQLLLLSEGRVMYHGAARDACAYFASIGFRAPSSFNPADFLIDLLSVDLRTPEKEATTKQRIEYVGEKHEANYNPSSGGAAGVDEEATVGLLEPQNENDNFAPVATRSFQNSWFKELFVLSGRSIKLVARAKVANGVQFFQVLFFSLLLGLLWLNNGRDSTVEAQSSIPGILFFITINQSFGGAFGVIFQFPLERSVVTRERAANMYRTSSYFLSKAVTDMVKGFFFELLFSLIVYWMVGLRATPGAFFQFVLALFLLSTFAESIALCIAVLTGDAQATSSLVPVVMVLCLLFGGFFINSESLPNWISWFRWCSFMFYGFNALGHIQFPVGSGDAILEQVRVRSGFNTLGYWGNIGAMIGLSAVVKVVAYLFLHYLRGPKFLRF